MNLVKIISTELENFGNNLKRRIIKLLRYGTSDFQTTFEAAPYGLDSNPIKDTVGVYADTGDKGSAVIIGYLNKKQLADVGEFRTYSTDKEGNLKFYTWIKNNGTMELGGNTKNLARFQELEQAFNQLKDDFNKLVQAYNSHKHIGVTAGNSVSGITQQIATQSQADISGAKIDEIKTL